jgi:hypothetical protein
MFDDTAAAGAPATPGRTAWLRSRLKLARLRLRLQANEPERGDVPGWVLVTLMTAGLVIALWAIAGPALQSAFNQAISTVTGFHP